MNEQCLKPWQTFKNAANKSTCIAIDVMMVTSKFDMLERSIVSWFEASKTPLEALS